MFGLPQTTVKRSWTLRLLPRNGDSSDCHSAKGGGCEASTNITLDSVGELRIHYICRAGKIRYFEGEIHGYSGNKVSRIIEPAGFRSKIYLHVVILVAVVVNQKIARKP